MKEMFSIGKIVNTHGIKGELRIKPSTDDVKRFEKLKEVYVEQGDLKTYEITNVRYHKDFVLLRFKGVET
ncbi:MAG: ribosome maturation factor RimM, partial [Cellulosilyticaceae bacterium]